MGASPHSFLGIPTRHFPAVLLLVVSYIVVLWLSELFVQHPATLFPASAIALAGLFLAGLELWPIVYILSLIGYISIGVSPLFVLVVPIALTLQAFTGAYLLRVCRVDPLFRRSRDIFLLIGIVLLVSLLVPSFISLTNILSIIFFHTTYLLASWGLRYTGTVFCLLVLTPFLLRWFAKVRFSRTPLEALETVLVFGVLILINFYLFTKGVETIGNIPLQYFLLVPLFWIALRLRPRFVTLALVITSIFAILSLFFGAYVTTPALFNAHLFQMETALIVLSMVFFIIVSIEEDRRLNTNLMKSQLSTLENAVAKVSSESNAKNDFIAVLAHELRNPLAPVVSAIDLLKLKPNIDSEEAETLDMMEDRMRTVRRLLDDLLDISRVTEGKMTLKKERVDLGTVARRAIISTTHHIKERHQSFTFNASKEELFVQGDAVRLEQVISNLLTNASKYSDSGDQITLTIRKKDQYAEIIVSDTGMGIAEEALQRIFTPFHQLDHGSRSKKGLGIGLALVKSFVEIHDGTVVATSRGVGKGSTFTVTIPLSRRSAPTEDAAQTEHTSDSALLRKKDGPRVLVVDDNDAAAWSMGKLLELQGCTVDYAYDGRQAIEKTFDVSPEVILLDLGLPDMDGYAVAKTIRARGYHGRIIALTGYNGEEVRERGSHAGIEHYVVTPASLADLKQVLPGVA